MRKMAMAHEKKEIFSVRKDRKNLLQIYIRGCRLKLENVAVLAVTIPGLMICGLSLDDPRAVKLLLILGAITVWGMVTYVKRLPEEEQD